MSDIRSIQSEFWTNKLEGYGDQHVHAVGSESYDHKILRYDICSQIFQSESNFSVLDVGAGVGDYFQYLSEKFPDRDIQYTGYEITDAFVSIAKEKYKGIDIRNVDLIDESDEQFDFVVLSGLFHQPGDVAEENWVQFMYSILQRAFQTSRKGIAFNIIGEYVDFKKPGNFYFSLPKMQTFILENLSRYFSMSYNSPLFEGTFFVLQPTFVRDKFPQKTFQNYMKY